MPFISFNTFRAFVTSRVRNEKLKQHILQALPFWVGSLITGIVAVLYARLFAFAEHVSLAIIHRSALWLFLLTPVCFVTAWWLVNRFARTARGSGIPQVMAAIELATPRTSHLVETLLSIKTAIIKIASSVMMVLGGGAIGREGPTIQIAGSIFWKINRMLPQNWPRISKRNMIMAGAAAGLAAAFNTPLGGIVFAVEELAKTHIAHFKTAIFTAVIIAGLTAQGILGPYLYLGYPDVAHLSPWIFFYVALVAVLAGTLGAGMSSAILAILRWKATITARPFALLYVIAVALIMAGIAYFFSMNILGSGKEQMSDILFAGHKHTGLSLPFLRVLGPVLSFTSGAAGGVFAPGLSAGATIGSFIAGLADLSGANANILVLSGMVAFLTGITRSPFTSAILVLEMTDRHNVIFHLMLAGMLASLVASLVQKRSFYEQLEDSYLHEVEEANNAAIADAKTVQPS